MDHLLDYFFLCSVIIGYAFILPERSRYQLLLMLAVFGAYDFSTFLAFAATDRLKISYLKFGPTEFRLALIVINVLLILFGTRYMIRGLKYVNAGAVVGLCILVYSTQKKVWQLDMEEKQRRAEGSEKCQKSYALRPESVRNVVSPRKKLKETFPAERHPIASYMRNCGCRNVHVQCRLKVWPRLCRLNGQSPSTAIKRI
jgi:hypothetical protein